MAAAAPPQFSSRCPGDWWEFTCTVAAICALESKQQLCWHLQVQQMAAAAPPHSLPVCPWRPLRIHLHGCLQSVHWKATAKTMHIFKCTQMAAAKASTFLPVAHGDRWEFTCTVAAICCTGNPKQKTYSIPSKVLQTDGSSRASTILCLRFNAHGCISVWKFTCTVAAICCSGNPKQKRIAHLQGLANRWQQPRLQFSTPFQLPRLHFFLTLPARLPQQSVAKS